MIIYECSIEALDYGKNPNAMKELRELLESFNTITITGEIIEDGDPIKDGAGAGYIIEIAEKDYYKTNSKICEITAKKYGVGEMYYRLGLGIGHKYDKN